MNEETMLREKKEAHGNTVPLSDIFFMTLRHWPWILLSVLICVGGAYFYLLRKPDIYTRAAQIQIKDDTSGQSSTNTEEFADLGLFKSNTNIQNEMINLKSKDLMEEVVRRMDLDIDYYAKGTFHDNVVYGFDLPVKVDLPSNVDNDRFGFALRVDRSGKVSIDNLRIGGGKPATTSYSGRLGEPIKTPAGAITVDPTKAYKKGEEVALLVSKRPVAEARDSYLGRLGVSMAGDKGTVINLTMADRSTQRADEVLNTLIGVYNENWIRDKNQIAISTSNFINDRLAVIENELGNVDSDISTYKSANMIPDVDAAASMYMNQSQQTQAAILGVNNQLAMSRYVRSYLTSEGNRDQLLPANTGLESSNLESQIAEYNDKMLQRNSLQAKSSDKNPLVEQLDEELAAERQAIVRTIDNEIVGLNTQLRSLRGSEAQTMSRIASNPTQAKNLLSVERQQKVKEALYLFLLQKREENELSQAFTAYNTRVVNKPGASGIPTTPNRSTTLAIAFLVGLLLPFGVTYLKEYSNTKVRGRKDVEHLAVPFVGEVPFEGNDKTKSRRKAKKGTATTGLGMVVRPGQRDVINEAFRVLRTNVEFMCNTNNGPKVIVFTSFNPQSGKSFVSLNLGMSLALKEKRVLVIDGDMRHCSTSAYVGSPAEGMADYLSGARNDLSALIKVDPECHNLSLLPVGSIPPNPTELLESPRFGEMIEELKKSYDYIIIDCPPIEIVADTQIIDKYADRTFFLVRAGVLDRAMVPELDRLYSSKRYANMAFILNGTRNDQGLGHSYSYGYGYGYGYGYNYTDSKKKKD